MTFNAMTTNGITNALHSCFLLVYFLKVLIHYLKNDKLFTSAMVCMFLTLLILKLLGVYVHIYATSTINSPGWIAISLIVILFNYFFTEAAKIPYASKTFILLLSVLSSFFFLTMKNNFIFIALPEIVAFIIIGYYLKGMARLSTLLFIGSNIFWIATRQITNYTLGYEVPVEYRYDNDLYHLMLIVSTYVLYLSITKGYWQKKIKK